MRISIGLAVGVMFMVPAFGEDVPFAVPSATRLGGSSDAYYSTLGDIMGLTQLRHIKLWYAGRAQNWPLAHFEIEQIKDTFDKAAMFYQGIPVKDVVAIDQPLAALRLAVAAKDASNFARAYDDLTTACNGCHTAAQVGFVTIQTPTASPFSDQRF